MPVDDRGKIFSGRRSRWEKHFGRPAVRKRSRCAGHPLQVTPVHSLLDASSRAAEGDKRTGFSSLAAPSSSLSIALGLFPPEGLTGPSSCRDTRCRSFLKQTKSRWPAKKTAALPHVGSRTSRLSLMEPTLSMGRLTKFVLFAPSSWSGCVRLSRAAYQNRGPRPTGRPLDEEGRTKARISPLSEGERCVAATVSTAAAASRLDDAAAAVAAAGLTA